MTILTIIDAKAPQHDDSADATITRADVRNGEVRLFAKRSKVGTLALTAFGDPAPTAETVEGILAAMDWSEPKFESDVREAIEAALEEATRRTGSVVPDRYRHNYGCDQNNGDDVALTLKNHCGGGMDGTLDLTRLQGVVDANGIRDRFDVWMAKELNNGMLRMNTGNVLRGKVKRGEVVRIGTQTWNAETPEA